MQTDEDLIAQYRAEAVAHIDHAMPLLRAGDAGAALALVTFLRRWMVYNLEAQAAIVDAIQSGDANTARALLMRGVECNFD